MEIYSLDPQAILNAETYVIKFHEICIPSLQLQTKHSANQSSQLAVLILMYQPFLKLNFIEKWHDCFADHNNVSVFACRQVHSAISNPRIGNLEMLICWQLGFVAFRIFNVCSQRREEKHHGPLQRALR